MESDLWPLLIASTLLLLALSSAWFRASAARPWLLVGRDAVLGVVVLTGILVVFQPLSAAAVALTLEFSLLLFGPAATVAAILVRFFKRRGASAVPAVTLAALGGLVIGWGVLFLFSVATILALGLPAQD